MNVSKLFDYAEVSSVYGAGTDADQRFRTKLPASAAGDTMILLRAIDPALGHMRALKADAADVKIVPDGSDVGLHQVALGSTWTTDGVAPSVNTYRLAGSVDIGFGDSHAMLGAPGYPSSFPNQPCGIEPADLAIAHYGDPNAAWTACSVRTLGDGSTVSTSSSKRGPGTIVFAVREFPGGHGVTITAIDFPLIQPPGSDQLDAAHVLNPSPWSEQSLAAALSSPDLVPGL